MRERRRKPRRRTPRELIELLFWLLQREPHFIGEQWADGAPPALGRSYVVADGLGTASYPTKPPGAQLSRPPWLDDLRPLIHGVDAAARLCGFSYSKPHTHYGARDTNILLLGRGKVLFRSYAPPFTPAEPVTYLGFSLGGTLLPLGLCDLLHQREEPLELPLSTYVPAIIMVQPALALQPAYTPTEEMGLRKVPAPIQEFADAGEDLQSELVACLRQFTQAGVSVTLLYWPGDGFLAYPPDLIERLRSAGVSLEPVVLPRDESVEPFIEHCGVASHETVKAALSEILRQLSVKGERG